MNALPPPTFEVVSSRIRSRRRDRSWSSRRTYASRRLRARRRSRGGSRTRLVGRCRNGLISACGWLTTPIFSNQLIRLLIVVVRKCGEQFVLRFAFVQRFNQRLDD